MTNQTRDSAVEAVAIALGLDEFKGHEHPVRWPRSPDDTLDGRDGKFPLAWDFAEKCRRRARVALDALASLPTTEVMTAQCDEGWQPIETAPKDGTIIDVWRDGSRETVSWGFRPHECGEMGQYCDSDWHSEKEPGWVCSTFGEFVGGKHDPFTHWMPLPAGPDAQCDESGAMWRHRARGSTYQVIGEAELQCATHDPTEGDELVIYRGNDGKLWARMRDEFHDGRFEAIAHPTPIAQKSGSEGEGVPGSYRRTVVPWLLEPKFKQVYHQPREGEEPTHFEVIEREMFESGALLPRSFRSPAPSDQEKRNAEIAAVVLNFIDRMNDVSPECGDPAERIVEEFTAAVKPFLIRAGGE